MRLSLREKQSLYDHLAQLTRAGVPFPAAVEKLASTSRGGVGQLLRRLRQGLDRGLTIAEAFAQLSPAVGEMERTALTALERTGRLDLGLRQLAEYFGAMAQARAAIRRGLAYPLYVLHLAVLLLNVQTGMTAGLGAYLRLTGLTFFFLYGGFALVALLIPLVRDAGTNGAFMDALLRRLPLVGKMRRSFALARFCGAYEMQLEAGVNVIDSLAAAGDASRSGLIRAAVARALPGVRGGSQVGPLLAGSRAFPEEMIRSLLVAEATGKLDQELPRMAAEFQADGMARLNAFAEWLPRLIYLGILLYIGWRIVSFYQGYYGEVMRQIDSM